MNKRDRACCKLIHFSFLLAIVLFNGLCVHAQFSAGEGTYDSPYEIDNLEDLRFLSENAVYWDRYFVLTQNLDASDTMNWNNGLGFSPIGDSVNGTRQQKQFTGNFDGGGHIISNLYCNRPNGLYLGIFGVLDNSTVKNLGLSNVTMIGDSNIGGLAGDSSNSRINYCFVTGSVDASDQGGVSGGLIAVSNTTVIRESFTVSDVSGFFAGGLLGFSKNDQVIDSWAGGTVEADQVGGGFIGSLDLGSIKRCYAIGEVKGAISGGFIGFNNTSGNIENSFFDLVRTQQSQGIGQGDGQGVTALSTLEFSDRQPFEIAGWEVDGIWEMGVFPNVDNITRPYLKMQLAPFLVQAKVFPQPAASLSGTGYYRSNEVVTLKYEVLPRYTFTGWYLGGELVSMENPFTFSSTESRTYTAVFTEDISFGGGDGSEGNPYQIAILEQLQDINSIPSLRAKHFILTADIDAAKTKNWNNGQGFKPIGDQTLPFSGSFNGQGHRITDLYINRTEQQNTGLFGCAEGAVISRLGLENCTIFGQDQTGGLVGLDNNATKISRSYVTGLIIGNSEVGSFIGKGMNSEVSTSYSLARTYGNDIVGGLMGSAHEITVTRNIYTAGRVLSEDKAGAVVSYRNNNTSLGGLYDTETTNMLKGTNLGDFGTLGYPSNFFSIPLIVNTYFDIINDWQLAYGQDTIKRPILDWQTPFVFNLSHDGNGSIDKEPIERIVSGTDFPPISAYPDEGYSFSHWLDEDTLEQWTSNPLRIEQVDHNYNLKAVFTPNTGTNNITITVENTVQVPVEGALLEWNGDLFRTDANGRVVLLNIPDDTYAFSISRSGYVPINDNLVVNGSDVDITMELFASNAFNDFNCDFWVLDGQFPLPNAQIVIQKKGGSPETFQANENGEFRFTGNGEFTYRVNAPGYEIKSGTFSLSGSSIFKKVSLLAAHDLELTITDGSNILTQAEITYQGIVYKANAQGVVQFQDMLAGTYNLLVSAPGYATKSHISVIKDEDVAETITFTSPNNPVRNIKFKITDGSRPIVDAAVLILQQPPLLNNTDIQGEAKFQLEEGLYTIRVFAPSYGTVEQNISVSEDEMIEITLAGPTQAITLSVNDGFEGLPDATVEFYGQTLTADSDGRIRFNNLVLGSSYMFTVSAPGYLSTNITIVVNPTQTFYSIYLREPANVTFKFSDGIGPISDVRLDFNGARYISNAQGEIRVSNLIRNITYGYSAEAEGYFPRSGGFVLSDADYTESLVFLPQANHKKVDFIIEDVASSPISFADIRLDGKTYVSDTDGRAMIGTLRDGRYPYTVKSNGFELARGTLIVQGNDVVETVVLKSKNVQMLAISGTVLDVNGNPLENVEITGFSTSVTTNRDGQYTTLEAKGWSGEITPVKQGYTFLPAKLEIDDLLVDTSGNDFTGSSAIVRYYVSGTVKDNQGNPLKDVIIEGFSTAVTTNIEGQYTALEEKGWSGNISPVMQGYTFLPAKIEINNLLVDTTGNDFMGTSNVVRYNISGTVNDNQGNPLEDVIIEGFSTWASTDANGQYSTMETKGWSGTIVPKLQGYTFTPENIGITDLQTITNGQNFVGSPTEDIYSISGTVTDELGQPLENVELIGFDSPVFTDTNGNYAKIEDKGWSGIITPNLVGYTFEPKSISINDLQNDANENNFTGNQTEQQYRVSGTVNDTQGQPLFNVVLKGFDKEVRTGENGIYRAVVSSGWSGTVIPEFDGYNFNPGIFTIAEISEDLTQDFVGNLDGMQATDFLIFPNPSRDGSFIVNNPENTFIRYIRVFSFSGMVHEETVNTMANSLTIEHRLPSGYYFVEISTDREVYTERLLVR